MAYRVSFIEGYVEHERISQHISNIRAINFLGKPIPEGITTYLSQQIEFIRSMVRRVLVSVSLSLVNPPAGEEKYWKHVGLMMDQLEGMVMGFDLFPTVNS